jgi:hypothetical protein
MNVQPIDLSRVFLLLLTFGLPVAVMAFFAMKRLLAPALQTYGRAPPR